MDSLDELIRKFEELEQILSQHKQYISNYLVQSKCVPESISWTYTFPGKSDEFTKTTFNLKEMLTDIRDWYDFVGLNPWTSLENFLKENSKDILYLSFKRDGRDTIFDYNSQSWMVKITSIRY